MHQQLVLALLLAAGCAAEARADSDQDQATAFYLVSLETLSGGCGDLGQFTVRLDAGSTHPQSGCTVDKEKWLGGGLVLFSHVTCVSESTRPIVSYEALVERDDGGLVGEIALSMSHVAGDINADPPTGVEPVCSGTYYATYEPDADAEILLVGP